MVTIYDIDKAIETLNKTREMIQKGSLSFSERESLRTLHKFEINQKDIEINSLKKELLELANDYSDSLEMILNGKDKINNIKSDQTI